MSGTKIAVRSTGGYDKENIFTAISEIMESLCIENRLSPGMKVVIKPNLLTAKNPNAAATTHPVLIEAIVQWLKQKGISHITVADSPGGPFISSWLQTVYSSCGYTSLADICELNYNTEWGERANAVKNAVCQKFNIIRPILDADYIINVPKLKTHGMTVFSAGIKNLFGCIPGLQKPEMHYRFQDRNGFAQMLIELACTVAPDLTILDAVEGMEGNGPSGGSARKTGCILASNDVFTLDSIAAEWIGLHADEVLMLKNARNMGLIKEEYEIDGELPKIKPFVLPQSATLDFMTFVPKGIRGPVKKIADKILRPIPKIDKKICVGCGKCAESCPPHTIQIEKNKAVIGYKKCISCFCCQEMCPVKAIRTRRLVRL